MRRFGQRWVGRLASVGRLESSILGYEILGFEDCSGASPHQLGPVRAQFGGEGVETLDEVIVELHQHFASSHDHMVNHMVIGPLPIVTAAS